MLLTVNLYAQKACIQALRDIDHTEFDYKSK